MEKNKEPRKRNFVPLIILGLLIIIGGVFGFKQYNYALHYEDTENAQIEGNISPVLPRIAGFVTEINAKENQLVKKGDILVKLDESELKVKVLQAQAAIETAIANQRAIEANVSTSGANVSTVAANVETTKESIEAAQIRLDKAQLEYDRYAKLLSEKSATQSQFDNVEAEKKVSKAQLEISKKQLEAARKQLDAAQVQADASKQQIAVAKATVAQRQADLEMAKLQLTYATIYAPANGKISKKNVQTGQFVQAGQNLMSVVIDEDLWVIANFKETQMGKMKEGQSVKMKVDMYPDVAFEGKVESIAGATGARFALLPPDNASGNFVKVVQRIPVKIIFINPDPKYPIRAGMNVDVVVKVN
jgi:membrane fusion protein (multidrug efflux system)